MIRYITFLALMVISFPGITQNDVLSAKEYKSHYLNTRSSYKHSSTKKFTIEEQNELNAILSDLEILYPKSSEYFLISYVNSAYNASNSQDLLKAYELNPTDEVTIKYMLAYYILSNNSQKQKEFVKKVDDFYSKNEWDYYKDLILTTGKGIIITSGQDDTYPLLATKMLYNIGADIELVCLDFLQNDAYRKRVQSSVNMTNTPFLGKEKYFISTLLKNSSKNIVISSTVNQSYLAQVETNIYLTGLGYIYNCTDQKIELDKFWKSIQTKNLAEISLKSSKDRGLYRNYIPPLLTLYKLQLLQKKKDPILRKTILLLAEKVKKEKTVENILLEYEKE